MGALLKLFPDQKACTKCGEEKSLSEFQHNVGHGKTRPTNKCKVCRSEQKKETWAAKHLVAGSFDKMKKLEFSSEGRECLTCSEFKSWDKFSKDAHGYNKKTATCSDCRNAKGREVYKTNPAVRRSGIKNRPDKLLKDYGITYADVVRTYDVQHGRCANHACNKEISLEVKQGHNRAMIDHNHSTGKFRALLCCACNFSLGYLEKQENILLGLQDYLTKHNKKGS